MFLFPEHQIERLLVKVGNIQDRVLDRTTDAILHQILMSECRHNRIEHRNRAEPVKSVDMLQHYIRGVY